MPFQRTPPRPPRPETRESIERALAGKQRRRRMAQVERRHSGVIVAVLAKLREVLDPEAFAIVQSQFLRGTHKLSDQMRRKRRRPGDGSMPALVEPPRGPRPLQGGAAAALELDE